MEPVFIVGAARSGTKYLRTLLSSSPSCSQIPYDVGYIWTHRQHYLNHDQLCSISFTPIIKDYVNRSLVKLALRDPKSSSSRYYLEKSVSNSLRPHCIDYCFNNAKIIYLVRNPFSVVESTLRQWFSRPSLSYLLSKLAYLPLQDLPYLYHYTKNILFSSVDNKIWGPRYRDIWTDLTNSHLSKFVPSNGVYRILSPLTCLILLINQESYLLTMNHWSITPKVYVILLNFSKYLSSHFTKHGQH